MVRVGAIADKAHRLALLLGVLLGLLTAALVLIYLNQQGGQSGAAADPLKPVVVAKEDIPAATRITAAMVTVRQVPGELALPNAFEVVQPLLDRVTRFPISAGEQVLDTDLALSALATGERAGSVPLSFIVPPGKRAVSVPITEVSGAGGLIRPGDFVDVIGVFDVVFFGVDPANPTAKEEVKKYVAMTILQNVEVLAVAQTVEALIPTTDRSGSDANQRLPIQRPGPEPKATTVTLAVTSQEAQKLFLAEEKGKLKLALRPLGETETPSLKPLPDIELLPPDLPSPFKPR